MKVLKIIAVFVLLGSVRIFAQNGIITGVAGLVEIKPAGSANFRNARTGEKVFADTIISTGFRSTALVQTAGALLTVKPLTRLTLAEIGSSSGTETINIKLAAGRVRVDVTPPAGTRASMTVSSPSATASVRGTSFEFDVQRITVLHGKVIFRGSNGRAITVSAGGTGEVTADGRAAGTIGKVIDLSPPSFKGSETGFSYDKTPDRKGEFKIFFILH
jgi:hypothetical protein